MTYEECVSALKSVGTTGAGDCVLQTGDTGGAKGADAQFTYVTMPETGADLSGNLPGTPVPFDVVNALGLALIFAILLGALRMAWKNRL